MIEAAAHYALAAVMACVAASWAWLLRSMRLTLSLTPRLEDCSAGGASPRVSVILPARNEEAYIGECLASLSAQDYGDYEIVAVNDSSEDSTGQIIARCAASDPRIVAVEARPKPDGWAGKSWACSEGYARAGGDLLLFTDADTRHAPHALSLAVAHVQSRGLDALTAMPQMRAVDAWTRAALPVISVFLHTRFSALRVNDPGDKMGYFFGSFLMMTRGAYERLGTHAAVRSEIVEDGALGRLAKAAHMRIRMVRGERAVDAVWARSLPTLWNALKRLMVPLYLQEGAVAVGILAAVAFLLFVPFALAAYSLPAILAWPGSADVAALGAASACASALAAAGAAAEARHLGIGARWCAASPLGGLVITLGFLGGIACAKSASALSWRGRTYSMHRMQQRGSRE